MTKKKQKLRNANIRRGISLLLKNNAINKCGYMNDDFINNRVSFTITVPIELAGKQPRQKKLNL